MPHGQSIVYSKYRPGGMDIIESTIAVPQKSRILSSVKGINAGASISPNGKYMALILSPDHKVDLYVVNLQTKRRLRITQNKAVEASPCWSPDGRKIAYVSDRTGVPKIYIVDLSNYKHSVLPSIGVDAVTPDWSSDNKIVYASRIGGTYTIAVYDTITGKNSQVIKEQGKWESPAWAADNRQVVCKRQIAGNSELWIIDTWTGRTRQLLKTNYPLSMPVWSPCLAK
jgi:TolB protein